MEQDMKQLNINLFGEFSPAPILCHSAPAKGRRKTEKVMLNLAKGVIDAPNEDW